MWAQLVETYASNKIEDSKSSILFKNLNKYSFEINLIYKIIHEHSNYEKHQWEFYSNTKEFVIHQMKSLLLEISNLDNSTIPEEEKDAKREILMRDFSIKSERIHTVNQLLKAYTLFEKDVEYVVMDNKVKIVDEQTGRIMDGRRYSDGLHQAIEAKEDVKVEAATQTYATITLQNYFRMYHKLSGMTGTAETEAKEFWDIYKLDVVSIPTNRPIQRDDKNDLVYKTNREKYNEYNLFQV